MKNIEQKIKAAIRNMQIIELKYDGGDLRRVEPHHYGILGGELSVHAYQLDGDSKSGNHNDDWKNFKFDKINQLRVTGQKFETRSNHKPQGSHYTEIKATVVGTQGLQL